MNQNEKTKTSVIVNSIIGVLIMVFFQFLPLQLPNVTDVGMQVLGIFIGTLYLWTTVDTMWSSLLCIAALGMSSYSSMSDILTSMLGNSMLILMLFIMILSGALVKFKITDRIARFFITRKITQGRPWMLMFMIGMGCLLLAGFVNPFAPIFLFWPILNSIFKEVGYINQDKMAKIMMMLVGVSTLIGFPIPSYMGNGLVCIGNFITVSENVMGQAYYINSAAYLLTGLIFAIVTWTIIILVCKFILRPDISKLKKYDTSTLEPLPPMDVQQRVISIGFVILILFMLIPSMIQADSGIFAYLSNMTYGMPMICALILAAIPYKNKPILDIQAVISSNFSWSTYFLCAAAILLASALTADSTGVSSFLSAVIVPLFNGMGMIPFMIVAVIIAALLTNICNSLVVAMVFEGIIANVCVANGFDPIPIVTIVIITCLGVALITPAASPFAAVIHGNKQWFKSSELYKYLGIIVVVEIICACVIGIPLSNALAAVF